MHPIALTAVFAGTGGVTGSAGRALLARLRRGTSVHLGWCELTVAVLWAVLGWRLARGHLPWWWLPVPLLLSWLAVLLAATDLRHRRLPDALTLPAYPVAAIALALAAALGGGWPLLTGAALGTATFLTIHAGARLLRPGCLGAGDVKLSATLGAVLGAVGWPALILATWLAALTTLALRILTPRRYTVRWHDGIPHGPGLLAATCLVTLFPAGLG
ncbi:MAG TPA: A24 family peptidase [Actinophytocola sp.]|jgi:leader peptidase (prepilin peptidase)/N-methyltransferase|uniref:A24 family peptidase n=1 Tax=Actinophytocola sp. TaxID=1872138 RepID=UPI002DFBFEBA|nr:A24 family peptidase [Actinophytocola sp.]